MKRILSLILAAIMLLSVIAVSASAAGSNAYGELSGDGKVTATDALIVLQHVVGKTAIAENLQKYADVDGVGGITSTDALLILQFSVGKIEKLPTFELEDRKLLFDLPDTLIHNGAYTYDTTADNSFIITGEGLAEKTIYVFSDGTFNAANANVKKDTARFIYSLQGLINRDFGISHTAILYSGTVDSWLKYMMEDGNFFNGYNIVEIKKLDAFMSTFKAQIEQCGIVLWDPQAPATANVAQTICGLDGYLPVKYDTGTRSFYTKLMAYKEADNGAYKLTVKQNLCGMFTTAVKGQKIADTDLVSTGSVKCDPYIWALDKYMDRCSSKYIAYIVDGAVAVDGNPLSQRGDAGSPGSTCLPNLDYLLARRCFFFDLTCFPNEPPCDDPNQELGTDAATMNKILQAVYDRNNGNQITQMMGFPPWWLKYTTHGNLGSQVPTTLEWMTVEVMTAYNCAKEADAAQPCSMTNGSAYYKYVSTTKEFKNNDATSTEKFDSNTYYFLFYLGDYDSSAWLKTHVANFWGDEKRGSIPMMWAFNPNLSYRVPMVFDYVYENASANDYFVAGEGAGYVIPSALYKDYNIYDFTKRTNPDGMKAWIEYSKPFYKTFDMDITGFIINGRSQIDSRIMSAYNRFSPVGSFSNSTSMKLVERDGTPYVYLQNGVGHTAADRESSVLAMHQYMSGTMKAYNFGAYRTICASPTQTYELAQAFIEYEAARGKTVKLVDPYTFFRLIKESGQAQSIN